MLNDALVRPAADRPIVEVGVLGEALKQSFLLAIIDRGGVANGELDDLALVVPQVGHHDGSPWSVFGAGRAGS